MSASTSSPHPRPHRIYLETYAFYLVIFGPLSQPISSTSWFLASALPMRDSANAVLPASQWMYTLGFEHGKRAERDSYSPAGGSLEAVNNVLIYRLTPPGTPARQGRDVGPDEIRAAADRVDMPALLQSEEKEWVGKLFVWRVLLELKRSGRIRIADIGLLWNEIVREIEGALEDRTVRHAFDPRIIQCSYTG